VLMTFAERFAQSKGQPIDVVGCTVHTIYRRKAYTRLSIKIRWLRQVDAPVQGVSMSLEGGALRVADSRAKDIVLWTDSAPDEVTLTCEGRNVHELTLWNCWRDDRGVTQAWVGNSGMIFEEIEAGRVRFRCNSRPEVTFQDLVFEVVFEEPS
jgi:hypothetical protein